MAGADGARLDVAADEFWGIPSQRSFFDIKVVNPLSLSLIAAARWILYTRGLKRRRSENMINV